MKKDKNMRFYWEQPDHAPEPPREEGLVFSVPGFKKSEIRVRTAQGMLTIQATKRRQTVRKEKGFIQHESVASTFAKSVALPEDVSPKNLDVMISDGAVVIRMKKKARKNGDN